jgi:choline dehydrogenase-like flavoprotein
MSSYDHLTVGGGSAGCVLAARLSEDQDGSVALIEAGGPDVAEEIHLPVAWSELFKGLYDWDLDSEPEPGLNGRRIYLPRGKVLGGCSSVNAMIYIRGARAAPGRRRVGDAGDRARQHQRADHHDRRESRRPDPRPQPAGSRLKDGG